MHLILLSALCSVLVGVLIKLAPRARLDIGQLVTWNYLAAGALCAWLLRPPMESLTHPDTPWVALLGLAVVLPSLFLVLGASVRATGIVRTDVAQRLSLLLSLLAAFTLFGERVDGQRMAGLALGLLAVAGIVARPERAAPAAGGERRGWLLLLVVWVGFALVDVMLKRIAQAGTPSMAALQVAFVLAFVLMLVAQLVRHLRGHTRLDARNLGAGLLLGLLNFGNIVFYVRAHQALAESPSVVFATMNIGVVVLGTLVGVFAFGEKTSGWNRAAIVLAILAIVLIAFAPRA
ncbi:MULTISPECIES: EamA family transporter [unclassified Lysobacter]|uniref:EamA family transporter n=1 Tax=unclassified Lysobacter TaxID=2635362 RepID=UPI001C23596E|nr:EamA family transporter [Lysobacter sp. MMG2]MBU8978213.1 DMT family transporter [Lysobacter sp. MMG2]